MVAWADSGGRYFISALGESISFYPNRICIRLSAGKAGLGQHKGSTSIVDELLLFAIDGAKVNRSGYLQFHYVTGALLRLHRMAPVAHVHLGLLLRVVAHQLGLHLCLARLLRHAHGASSHHVWEAAYIHGVGGQECCELPAARFNDRG